MEQWYYATWTRAGAGPSQLWRVSANKCMEYKRTRQWGRNERTTTYADTIKLTRNESRQINLTNRNEE